MKTTNRVLLVLQELLKVKFSNLSNSLHFRGELTSRRPPRPAQSQPAKDCARLTYLPLGVLLSILRNQRLPFS